MRTTDKYILFHGGIFSNWYPAAYVWQGIRFHCSEQHYFYLKALYFLDYEMADKILKCHNASEAKRLGHAVQNFNGKNWEDERENAMYTAVKAKFSAIQLLRKRMLSKPRDKHFAESSPFDLVWGIGYSEDDPRAADEKNWKGQNLLGKVMDRVRDELIKEYEGFKLDI